MSTLKTESLLFEEKKLHTPSLEDVKAALDKALPKNFHEVAVEVVKCPDLQEKPFNLVSPGLCGSPTLIEVGGPPFLLPTPDATKIYNVKEIVQKSIAAAGSDILGIGAGAGPFPAIGCNCEGIFNFKITKNGEFHNKSYVAKVHGADEACVSQRLDASEERFAVLLNLFACKGNTGNVLKVKCKKRIGPLNFIESIRLALTEHFREKTVGLGGIFLLKAGKAKQHVMRDFSKTPIHTEEELNNWLKFYEMPATLNAVGTLITQETDLDLRLQHFHSFSDSHWAGHFHYDITPDTVEYEGYFSVGEKVVRVDKPMDTHKFGRD